MNEPLKDFLEKGRAEQIHTIGQTQANVRSAYGTFKAVLGGLVFVAMGLFFIFIAQVYLVGIVIFVAGLMIPVGTYLNRKKEMNLLSQVPASVPVNTPVSPSDESIVGYVAGVAATGMHAATFAVGGGGQLAAPENSILVTDKNIWFVYVPLPGADVVTQDTGVGIAQFDYLLAHDEIEQKLKEILDQGGLQAVINTSKKNFAISLSNLMSISFSILGNVVFETKEGKKYTYGIRRSEDKEKLKLLLQNYLK